MFYDDFKIYSQTLSYKKIPRSVFFMRIALIIDSLLPDAVMSDDLLWHIDTKWNIAFFGVSISEFNIDV